MFDENFRKKLVVNRREGGRALGSVAQSSTETKGRG